MPRITSSYETWIAGEGIPIVSGYGVEDVLQLPRRPWPRLGGTGTFIKMEGQEGLTGMYVIEVPAGGELHPERHLYEELLYVLRGSGSTSIRSHGGPSTEFRWQEGTLFGIPLNTVHSLRADESGPAILLAVTTAPIVLDLFHSSAFVFGSSHEFTDRYDGSEDYFQRQNRRVHEPHGENVWLWEANLLSDVPNAVIDSEAKKGAGMKLTQLEMTDGVLVAHVADWPVGSYQKGHYHGGGATLLILRGHGYTLMWPNSLGERPYESGHGDKVVRVDWKVGSVVSPPDGWFHQHFNSSPVSARQLAMRFGSRNHGVEFHNLRKREGVYLSSREGGTIIEYADEDPEIRRIFLAACAESGVECVMKP